MTAAPAALTQFVNEPLLELRRAPQREALRQALAELDLELPLRVPVIIAGERGEGGLLESRDPGAPQRIVATAAVATAEDVDQAVAAATRGHLEWGSRSAQARAEVLERAAGLLLARRRRLAALIVRECAKPWVEADADVCEAIDFLRYYARQAVALADGEPLIEPLGERNRLHHRSLGVVAAIAPWNFPLAIATGMTAGALAAGNAAILKPAEQSPACALALAEALLDAGLPAEAFALLPGGEQAGAALVRHPGVHAIVFTGSAAAGLEIIAEAAQARPGQHHIKRVVAEMGGKNCVIVDSDADLDEAVPAIVRSAYAFAGQKCSAASRVLAHEAIAEPLRRRLAGAVRALSTGQAEVFGIDVPPLIDDDARRRVAGYVQAGAQDGEIAARGADAADDGYFCSPTLICGLRPDSALNSEEIFGPVLTVEAVAGVDAACDIVDSLPFALTGGVFSRDPQTVARVVQRSPAGNLYINREITGAVVGRQAFGGNRLSGTGPKAGGPGYLLAFSRTQVVCENTTRHGLVM